MSTILVVEDEPSILRLIQVILTKDDSYEVLYASAAAEGIRRAVEFPRAIDLLLVNIVLDSGILGSTVAMTVKEKYPKMRVILINGKESGELSALASGWQFLGKPFVDDLLIETVRAALRGGAATGR